MRDVTPQTLAQLVRLRLPGAPARPKTLGMGRPQARDQATTITRFHFRPKRIVESAYSVFASNLNIGGMDGQASTSSITDAGKGGLS